MSSKNTHLTIEVKAWLKRHNGANDVIRVLPDHGQLAPQCYELYTAYENHPEHLGRLLFDDEGYWIYDGNDLTIDEQEQLARVIIGYVERL